MELEDFGPECSEPLCCLRDWVTINLGARDARRPQQFWQKLLDHRAVQVCQHRVCVRVGFHEPAPSAIGTQEPFVPQGAGFLLATCDHRSRNALECIQLSLMDGEIDRDVDGVHDHGPTPFKYSQGMLPRLDSFEHAAIVPAQIAPAERCSEGDRLYTRQ